MYRQMVNFPDAPLEDILQLNKLKLPVTEGNLAQYESYRNLSYQLTEGIQATADEVIQLYDTLSQANATPQATTQAVNYMDNVVKFLLEGLQTTTAEGDSIPEQNVTGQNVTTQQGVALQQNGVLLQGDVAQGVTVTQTANGTTASENGNVPLNQATVMQEASTAAQGEMSATATPLSDNGVAVSQEQPTVIIRDGEPISTTAESANQAPVTDGKVSVQDGQPMPQIADNAENIAAKEKLLQQLSDFLSQTPKEKETTYRSEPFRKAVAEALDRQWTLTPDEVAKDGEITHFYRKLAQQSEQLSKLMQDAAGNTTAGESARNIQQNVEFMNDLNQTLQYVQIPLMMSGNKANGELYVYSNKRHLARKDGTITALLHLDMEHLGKMDFRLSLDTTSNILTTHISLQEEYMDFLESHLSELTQRLEQAGYQCKTYIEPRIEEEKTVLERLEEQIPNGSVRLNYQSFDIKA